MALGEIIRLPLSLEEAGSLLEMLTILVDGNELWFFNGPLPHRLEVSSQKMKDFKSIQQTLIDTLNTF